MYYTHFGLTEAPFSIAPNPAYLFMTERHQEALAHLYHGIQSDAGFVLLTGDVGTGKTTVCRRFLHHLPQNTQVAFILNPCVDRIELLQAISKELAIPASKNEKLNLRQLTDNLHDYLLSNHAKGVNTVLLVDEAQQIHPPVLEFIRLLTNLETDRQKLLKIILVGQPELNDLLAQPAMVQLSQRITARFHIYPLTVNEITHYIHHRLQVAGYTREQALFSARRIKQLFTMTKGVPRLINVICDRALLGAYSQNATSVGAKVLAKAHHEVSGNYIASVAASTKPKRSWPANFLLSALCVALLAGLLVLWWPNFSHAPLPLWGETPMAKSADAIVMIEPPSVSPSVIKNNSVFSEKNIVIDARIDKNSTPTLAVETIKDTPVQEQAAKEKSEASVSIRYYESKQDALSALIRYTIPQPLSIKKSDQQTCDRLRLLSFRCETVSEPSWQEFKKYNRPAIITLRNNDDLSHVVVVGTDEGHVLVIAEVVDADQQKEVPVFTRLPVSVIEEQWVGNSTFIWQAPLGFERFIFKESKGALIDWLAKAFAIIDQKDDVLAKGKYNRLLEKRIRLFQKKYGLKEDGKAGMETLLKLNEVLGIAVTLDGNVAVYDKVTGQQK